MKRLIATRADENVDDFKNLTHPYLKKYAEKCNADFLVLNDKKDLHRHYMILQFYDLFDKYDSILSVDTDVIITNRCEDIFEISEGKICSIFEDKGTRKEDRRNRIKLVQEKFGDVGWKKNYINTGFALFHKEYRDIFEPKKSEELWMDLGYDDVWLGYQIHKKGYKIKELSPEYNFMSMFQESWSKMSKSEAKVIHYAGQGFHINIDRVDEIRQDLTLFKKYRLL